MERCFFAEGMRKEGCLSADQPIFKSANLGDKSEVIGTLSFCLPLEKLGAAIGIAGSDQFRSDRSLSFQAIGRGQAEAIEEPDYLEFHRGDYTGRVTYLIFESGNIVFPTATDSRFVRISIQSPRRLSTTAWGKLNRLVTRRGNLDTFQEINLDGNTLLTYAMTSSGGNTNWTAVNVTDKQTIFDPLNKALFQLLTATFNIANYQCRNLFVWQLTRPLNQIISHTGLERLGHQASKKYIIKKAWICEINNVSLATNRLTWAIESFSYIYQMKLCDHFVNERRAELGGISQNVVVMFTISIIYVFAESVQTEDLFRYLNEYFTELTTHVIANKGTIDKYIASLMVMWGMPTLPTNPCGLQGNSR